MKIIINEYTLAVAVVLTLILIITEIIIIRKVKKRLWQKWQRESSHNTVYNIPQEKTETSIPPVTDYEAAYLRPAETVSRNGRNVNIRNEFHAKITSLICVFPEKHISIYGYIDHVLENHFRQYHREILSLIARKGCRFDIWKSK